MQRSTDAKTLVETAYRRIKQLMLQQKIATGQKLLYRELIDWLQMSKTPIINALNKLEEEGLVVYHTNRGYFVRQLTEPEVIQMYDLRDRLLPCRMDLHCHNDYGLALAISERENYQKNISLCLANCGVVQNKIRHYEEALNLYRRSLRRNIFFYDPQITQIEADVAGQSVAESGREWRGFLV